MYYAISINTSFLEKSNRKIYDILRSMKRAQENNTSAVHKMLTIVEHLAKTSGNWPPQDDDQDKEDNFAMAETLLKLPWKTTDDVDQVFASDEKKEMLKKHIATCIPRSKFNPGILRNLMRILMDQAMLDYSYTDSA